MPAIVDIVRRVVAPLTHTRLFRRWAPVLLPPLERFLARATGGRVQVSAILVPSLVLHTRGAKSDEPRDAVLMYTPDGHGRAIVAGSNFADGRHPAWSTNLIAHPDAAITVRGRRMAVHASRVPDGERDAVWARIERQWPGYREYERASGRVVRLFVLQPVR
ncbi:nitroreductase family deazaflavin-dependent oxidoreductase [Microbacterium rhizomatis]|uniref:Nitroreductase family deazaflavin-dependent oxidoreductase n=1 Tax=Microbacterium rhizomatis TaxID=1631477 RepID=A0A5J5IZA4_9MICO|nr:nitroreductase family deazaflavin-dependent oxidoreductase [Microbacterium rhizomatis]KAA9107656.1 nitroreductase family deazaflavin-dependent oxidoreductase [Microbacterium rhizomatis]